MMYNIEFTPDAQADLAKLLKSEPKWSRELTKKHRLVYRIYENEVLVLVISAYGHYNDK